MVFDLLAFVARWRTKEQGERERKEQTHAHIKEPEHLKETQVKRAKVYIVLVQFYTWTLSCFYIF